MNKSWTKQQIDYLKLNYPTGCMDEMCGHLNKTVPAIRTQARKLGIRRAASIHIHEYAMYNGDEYETDGTAYEIGEKLGIAPESVAWYASKSTLERLEKTGTGRIAVKL